MASPIIIEEMDKAIGRAARRMWKKFEGQRQ
jgi:hypothetical protein